MRTQRHFKHPTELMPQWRLCAHEARIHDLVRRISDAIDRSAKPTFSIIAKPADIVEHDGKAPWEVVAMEYAAPDGWAVSLEHVLGGPTMIMISARSIAMRIDGTFAEGEDAAKEMAATNLDLGGDVEGHLAHA